MFIAKIDETKASMIIEPGFLDSQLEDIASYLKKEGGPVILDTDNKRLEAIACQMGLAVTYDDVVSDYE